MEQTMAEEEAVRHFASALLALLNTVRTSESARVTAEIRRCLKEAQDAEAASFRGQDASVPLLLSARQAAKSLAISAGTLWHYTSPRGPIPVVRIGTRTCYAIKDLEAAIDTLKTRPIRSASPAVSRG